MCGIIGYVGNQDPKGVLLDGLKRLEYRGYDSAGIAVFDGNRLEIFRSEGRLTSLEKKLEGRGFLGSVGMGHTRWATHGAPTEVNAHPHRAGSIALIHNGIIENYFEHKQAMLSLNRSIKSETDSEIVAHLLDVEVGTGKTLQEATLAVFCRLRGSFAFVTIDEKHPEYLVAARNGPPLLIGLGENENFVTSDVHSILHRTKRIIYLEDDEIVICWKNKVDILNLNGRPVSRKPVTIHWDSEQTEKLGYRHFMIKEIHEQPQAIMQTIEGNVDKRRALISLSEMRANSDRLKQVRRILIAACGTAKHAALVGKYYLERFAKIPVDVDFASEFRYRVPLFDERTLLVLVSQSGETADTLGALRLGKASQMPTLSICNVRHSTLARESDIVLYTNAGPEIGVASTKAFTTQLSMFYMLSIHLGLLRDELSKSQAEELTMDLLRLPYTLDKALKLETPLEKIAVEIGSPSLLFYIGRGNLFPIALEGALKMKEISYLHAEGYPAGELKHGPIALIDRTVVSIVVCPKERENPDRTSSEILGTNTLYEKTMSNLLEIKARGGKIFVMGTENDKELQEQADYFVGLPVASWAVNPILYSIPIQLLAYHAALNRGTDIDKPRNLAKSVTVE